MADLADFSTPDTRNGPPGPTQISTQRPYRDLQGNRLWRCERANHYILVSGEGAGLRGEAALSGGTVTIKSGGITIATVTAP